MEEFQHFVKYFGVFGVALVTSLMCTPVMVRWGHRFGLVDMPNERCIHSQPIPRSGGLAVIIGFFAGCLSIFYLFWPGFSGGLKQSWVAAFFASSFILIAVGLYDDKKGLKPRYKLVGQTAAASLMFYLSEGSFGTILHYDLPPVLDFGLTLFWFLALINAFNLVDGLDGLCAGITVISALGLAVSFVLRGISGDSLIALSLAGAALGFLRYNFHPARIFLGDTGSMFCGFALAAIALQTGGKSTLAVTVGLPLVAAGIPAMDTALAIWRRSIRKMIATGEDGATPRIMQPDRDHIHHRLLDQGMGQRKVAVVLYLGALFLVALGLLSLMLNTTLVGLFLILFTTAVYVVIRHVANIELWDTGRLILRRANMSKRGLLSLLFYPLWDLAWLSLAMPLAALVAYGEDSPISSVKDWLFALPLWLTPVFLAMAMKRIYQRVWFHCSVRDYFALLRTLIIGSILSLALVSIAEQHFDRALLNRGMLFGLFAFFGIIGIRTTAPVFRDWMVNPVQGPVGKTHAKVRKILLYGAGSHGGLYMRQLRFCPQKQIGWLRVAGFVDDDPFLRKRFIHGVQVLGGAAEMESIVDEYGIDEIIVTTKLSGSAWDSLRALAVAKQVAVSLWYSGLLPVTGLQTVMSDAPAPQGNGVLRDRGRKIET